MCVSATSRHKYSAILRWLVCVAALGPGLFAVDASARDLVIAQTRAPDINCVFTADCHIAASDLVNEFDLVGAAGKGRLQSRISSPGEAGTPGAGLANYMYRIDLTNTVGIGEIPCIASMTIDFGDIEPRNYDADHAIEDIYVVAGGGLGSVGPSRAVQTGSVVEFFFSGLCAGGHPGDGISSYFFGLASVNSPREISLELRDGRGAVINVEARAPQAAASAAAPPERSVRFCLRDFPDLTVDPDAPICRCLADRGAHEFQCALVSPDYFLAWRTRFPLPRKGPIDIDWMLTPLSKAGGAISIVVNPQQSKLRPADKKSARVVLKSGALWKPVMTRQHLIGGPSVKPRALEFEVTTPGAQAPFGILAIPPDDSEAH